MATIPNRSDINKAAYEYSAEVIEFIIHITEEEPLLSSANDVRQLMRVAARIQRGRALVEESTSLINRIEHA